MLDQLASIVANGTTFGGWGYEPWLPFYNFFPILILVSVFVSASFYLASESSFTRATLAGSVVLTSGLSAVFVVGFLWWKLDLMPDQVLFWWAVNWLLCMIGQTILIRKDERTRQRIKAMEDRENV